MACATGVLALARVTDPLRQVRQQLQGGPGNRSSRSCWARPRSIWSSPPAKCGRLAPDGALDVEMAPGARRDPAPEGARRTGSRRRPRTAYPSSCKPAAGACAARRRRARHPRAAHELRVPPLAAALFAAGRKRIADWRARAGNYWLGLAPRERRMLAGCALLALAALCWLALIEPALVSRARAELTPARLEHRAGNIAGQRASRANRARPGEDGSVAAPRPGAGRFAGRRDGARPDGRWRLSLEDARSRTPCCAGC